MTTEEQHECYASILVMLPMLLEGLDTLEDTSAYHGDIKNNAKKLMKSLKKYDDDFYDMLKIEPVNVPIAMEGKRRVIKAIMKLKSSELIEIGGHKPYCYTLSQY